MPTQPTPPDTPFLASNHQDTKKHLLLATTGSVATIKLPQLLTTLSQTFSPKTLTIHLLLTPSSKNFLSPTDLHEASANPLVSHVWSDEDEWAFPSGVYTRECSVLHIELRKWAHVLVVAPLSANTLSSIVVGRCDGLLLSVLRAWDWGGAGGVVVAPAMNTLGEGEGEKEDGIEVVKG
ncbi:flavo protein [Tuber magnatum]|uniref:Flavo protein n=1 Tax=Tuber magnatum TaxID=42249 RepID=A0A317SXT4_9PEZI|nr:flavo protein [Tuber magnatum]